MLSIIVAAAENNVIGRENKMPWHLPDDLKHFKRTTKGHYVIQGRKTFDSQGRPLPKRTNIVITRKKDAHIEGCLIAHSLDEAIAMVKEDNEPFIIGGEEIYRQAMEKADRIYLTRVHGTFAGDTYFPEIDKEQWKVISSEYHEVDDRHAYSFTVYIMERKSGF